MHYCVHTFSALWLVHGNLWVFWLVVFLHLQSLKLFLCWDLLRYGYLIEIWIETSTEIFSAWYKGLLKNTLFQIIKGDRLFCYGCLQFMTTIMIGKNTNIWFISKTQWVIQVWTILLDLLCYQRSEEEFSNHKIYIAGKNLRTKSAFLLIRFSEKGVVCWLCLGLVFFFF